MRGDFMVFHFKEAIVPMYIFNVGQVIQVVGFIFVHVIFCTRVNGQVRVIK